MIVSVQRNVNLALTHSSQPKKGGFSKQGLGVLSGNVRRSGTVDARTHIRSNKTGTGGSIISSMNETLRRDLINGNHSPPGPSHMKGLVVTRGLNLARTMGNGTLLRCYTNPGRAINANVDTGGHH